MKMAVNNYTILYDTYCICVYTAALAIKRPTMAIRTDIITGDFLAMFFAVKSLSTRLFFFFLVPWDATMKTLIVKCFFRKTPLPPTPHPRKINDKKNMPRFRFNLIDGIGFKIIFCCKRFLFSLKIYVCVRKQNTCSFYQILIVTFILRGEKMIFIHR